MKVKNPEKIKCLVLVARIHGLETLRYLVEKKPKYAVIGVFTHKLNPKSYDPMRRERSDFPDYVKLTKSNNIPFFTIDSKEELSTLENFCKKNNFDFIISISWRYLISPQIFKKARLGAINLHRGDLPKYPGVEPIRKALENNEKEIVICAHHINESFDQGEVIYKARHPVNYEISESLESNIERLKKEITPYFIELTVKSLKLLENQHDKPE